MCILPRKYSFFSLTLFSLLEVRKALPKCDRSPRLCWGGYLVCTRLSKVHSCQEGLAPQHCLWLGCAQYFLLKGKVAGSWGSNYGGNHDTWVLTKPLSIWNYEIRISFFKLIYFYWIIVDLQCWVITTQFFICKAESLCCTPERNWITVLYTWN